MLILEMIVFAFDRLMKYQYSVGMTDWGDDEYETELQMVVYILWVYSN